MVYKKLTNIETKVDNKLKRAVEYKQHADAITRLLIRAENTLCSLLNETKTNVKSQVFYFVDNNLPICLRILQGCYKNPNVPSTSYANWAEVFNLSFMSKLLSQIAQIYDYGVVLEYELEDVCLDKLNNLSKDKVLAYFESFDELVKYYNGITHPNVAIKTKRYSSIISEDAFSILVEKELVKLVDFWKAPENEQFVLAGRSRAMRNNTSEYISIDELDRSAMYHTAYLKATAIVDSMTDNKSITFVHRKSLKNLTDVIPYRSCENSSIQFWVGEGCLVKENNRKYHTILGTTQLTQYKKIGEIVNNFLPIDNPNLKALSIYEKI